MPTFVNKMRLVFDRSPAMFISVVIGGVGLALPLIRPIVKPLGLLQEPPFYNERIRYYKELERAERAGRVSYRRGEPGLPPMLVGESDA